MDGLVEFLTVSSEAVCCWSQLAAAVAIALPFVLPAWSWSVCNKLSRRSTLTQRTDVGFDGFNTILETLEGVEFMPTTAAPSTYTATVRAAVHTGTPPRTRTIALDTHTHVNWC